MRRLQLAILLGVACFLGTDSAAFVPLRTLSPVTCLGFAPELSQGTHFRALLGGDEKQCFKLELKRATRCTRSSGSRESTSS
ncbi:MAG: hypothetical protein HC897_05845 [Thermoanaerobaculia bacterium]|nr:hypothetical protein [Thermoanaerobaculia bacterium]